MNDDQLSPEQGIFAALRNQAVQSQVDGIPSFHRHMEAMTKIGGEKIYNNIGNSELNPTTPKVPENILRFQNIMNRNRGSLLFGEDDDNDNDGSTRSLRSFTTASSSRSLLSALSSSASSEADGPGGEQSLPNTDASVAAAFEKKNLTRKKFGLKPIT